MFQAWTWGETYWSRSGDVPSRSSLIPYSRIFDKSTPSFRQNIWLVKSSLNSTPAKGIQSVMLYAFCSLRWTSQDEQIRFTPKDLLEQQSQMIGDAGQQISLESERNLYASDKVILGLNIVHGVTQYSVTVRT